MGFWSSRRTGPGTREPEAGCAVIALRPGRQTAQAASRPCGAAAGRMGSGGCRRGLTVRWPGRGGLDHGEALLADPRQGQLLPVAASHQGSCRRPELCRVQGGRARTPGAWKVAAAGNAPVHAVGPPGRRLRRMLARRLCWRCCHHLPRAGSPGA